MTDFKARARELAEKAWDEARTQDQAITAFECALLQFGREVLLTPLTPIERINMTLWQGDLSTVRAKELE